MCILEVHCPESWESGEILTWPLADWLLGPGANLLSDHNRSLRILTPPAHARATSSCVDGGTDGSTLSLSSPSGHHSPHSTRAQCSPKTQVLHTC